MLVDRGFFAGAPRREKILPDAPRPICHNCDVSHIGVTESHSRTFGSKMPWAKLTNNLPGKGSFAKARELRMQMG